MHNILIYWQGQHVFDALFLAEWRGLCVNRADMQASLQFSLCADQKSGCQSAPSCDLVVILQSMYTRPSWYVLGKVIVNSNHELSLL
jgi:hypothetical protein